MNKGNKKWENIHSPAFFQLLHVDLWLPYFWKTPSQFLLEQGHRRLLESGTAIEHRWCSPSADGTKGGGTSRKGGLGDLPQENFVIQDD